MLHVGLDLPILVMSVHTNVDGTGLHWLKTQHHFLKTTTHNFVHAICLVNADYATPPNVLVVAHQSSDATGGEQHIGGLKALTDYARRHKNQYRAFLVLDSDCFPIANWESHLSSQMAAHSKNVACISRPENLDTFAHPAAVYTKDSGQLKFGELKSTNLLGEKVADTACFTPDFFPMLRTNKVNLHPVAFGVYYDLFYHHGAGSRNPHFRSDLYYGTKLDPRDDFFKDPRSFIDKLA